ncbi:hypothetical protein [Solimonas sp. K1W22B-7]|uniref:hypothetical protein n=1 Tax=Solimonas sp. K1W22B-7 TaxID=2303331 RepID=UPI0013C41941|nr:hypothetical protein [Solimonas sp. K1W22B-7]
MSERLPDGFVLETLPKRTFALRGTKDPTTVSNDLAESDSFGLPRPNAEWTQLPLDASLSSLLRQRRRTALQGNYGGGYGIPVRQDFLQAASQRKELPMRDAGARKGTYFIGGAGLDGSYIDDMVRALSNAGISNVSAPDRNFLSNGMMGDILSVPYYDDDRDFDISKIDMQDMGPQLNLIGYSYGSLMAAQIADSYAKQGGVVDNLVLLGSPIAEAYLKDLRRNPKIKNVKAIDLTQFGDPLYAGISEPKALAALPSLFWQMTKGSGHFHYAPENEAGRARRALLAQQLYNENLR